MNFSLEESVQAAQNVAELKAERVNKLMELFTSVPPAEQTVILKLVLNGHNANFIAAMANQLLDK